MQIVAKNVTEVTKKYYHSKQPKICKHFCCVSIEFAFNIPIL